MEQLRNLESQSKKVLQEFLEIIDEFIFDLSCSELEDLLVRRLYKSTYALAQFKSSVVRKILELKVKIHELKEDGQPQCCELEMLQHYINLIQRMKNDDLLMQRTAHNKILLAADREGTDPELVEHLKQFANEFRIN